MKKINTRILALTMAFYMTFTIAPITSVKAIDKLGNENKTEKTDEVAPHDVKNFNGKTNVNTTVVNNYTDVNDYKTIYFIDGKASIEGNYSGINKIVFEELPELAVTASYDEATNVTTLIADISKIERGTEDKNYETKDYEEIKTSMTTEYTGSKLTYTGTTYGEDGEKVTINEIRDDYYTRTHKYVKYNMKITGKNDPTYINNIEVVANISYIAGDTPFVTAGNDFDENASNYKIAYEYWEEMEKQSDGSVVPVKYWYSDEAENAKVPEDKKITSFEEGKTYMYSLKLETVNGYAFASKDSGFTMTLNGNTVDTQNIQVSSDGTSLFATALRTLKPSASWQEIKLIEINDATINFNVGDKPVFTGKVPEGAHYVYQFERWQTEGAGITSADFFNRTDDIWKSLITEFQQGKTYSYGLYLKAERGYYFSRNTKLKVNGKIVDYEADYYDIDDPDFMVTFWLETNLTMTPTSSSHTHNYKAEWKIDKDSHWHECECGDIADKASHDMEIKGAKEATTTEAGYTGDKVCKVCGYTIKGNEIAATGTGNDAKSDTKPTDKTKNTKATSKSATTKPKTGDEINMSLWFAILFVSCGGVISYTVYAKKRKLNR